jgi:hypothetical protein
MDTLKSTTVTALLNLPDFMNIDDMYSGLETHPVSPRTDRVANTAILMVNQGFKAKLWIPV